MDRGVGAAELATQYMECVPVAMARWQLSWNPDAEAGIHRRCPKHLLRITPDPPISLICQSPVSPTYVRSIAEVAMRRDTKSAGRRGLAVG